MPPLREKFEHRTTNYFSPLGDSQGSNNQPGEDQHLSDANETPILRAMITESQQSGADANCGVEAHCPRKDCPESPTSISSSDTLNEDGSSFLDSSNDTVSLNSPLSPELLDFDSLSISNMNDRGQKSGFERYKVPFQRGIRKSNDSGYSYRTPIRRDAGMFSPVSFYSSQTPARFDRNAHTWMSADAQAHQEFMVIRNAMRRLFKYSEVSKWKLTDYIAHRHAMVEADANVLSSKVKAKEDALIPRVPPISMETQQALHKWGLKSGNFNQHGNFSRVLGERTIWCHDWMNGKDEIAPWPSLAELKWEGDDRAKTGVGRFLPLPREEGPPGLSWNQLPVVEQHPMDQVALVPTLEDIYLPIDAQIEEEKEYLWSKDLEKTIDTALGL